MASKNRKRLATTREVAEYLRITVQTVRLLMRDGKLTAYTVNGSGKYLFRWAQVESLLTQVEQRRPALGICAARKRARIAKATAEAA